MGQAVLGEEVGCERDGPDVNEGLEMQVNWLTMTRWLSNTKAMCQYIKIREE